jgi:hypothetical protein
MLLAAIGARIRLSRKARMKIGGTGVSPDEIIFQLNTHQSMEIIFIYDQDVH